MAHFYSLDLLLLVQLVVTSGFRETVVGTQDDDVVLPCSIANVTAPRSCYRVKWMKYATDGSQMKVNLAKEANKNGQMSLFLTKLQKSNEGLYRCEIWQDWDLILVKNISLKVKECRVLQAVKAAPSTPVNLNCPVDKKAGQSPNISWEMLKGSKSASVDSGRVKLNGTSFSIWSVNHSDSGWYRCKSLLGQTQRCFDVHLIVQVGNVAEATTVPVASSSEQGSKGTIIAAVASAIVGIAVMAALIGLFICRRRSNQIVTWHGQRPPAGTLAESVDVYETVNLSSSPSEDPAYQRVNSLYQQFQDNTMCTFHY